MIKISTLANNLKVIATYDTAAISSAVSEDWVLENNLIFEKKPIEVRQAMSKGTSLGRVSLTIKIGALEEICKFLVIKNLSQKMLIGLDIIKKFRLEQRVEGIYQYLGDGSLELISGLCSTGSTRRNLIQEDIIPPSEFDLNEEFFCHEKLRSVIGNFEDVFQGIGKNEKVKHKIVLTVNKNINISRRVPYNIRTNVEEHINDLLKEEIIEESKSDFCSPILPIKKKDGSIRLAIDYRQLNAISKKDKFPMPRLDELIDNLGNSIVFSKLDLTKGYYQIVMDEESKPLTAFSWNKKLYHFNRMPFGLVTAPQTFQRLMTKILGDLPFVQCYLDDVIIFSKNIEEHQEHVKIVLERIRSENLKLNKNKCQFGRDEIRFLGFQIKNGSKKIPKDKIKSLLEFPRPKSKCELQRFIGMANFYRSLIPNFSDMSKPLYDCTKQKKFVWNVNCEVNFNKLKEKLSSFPVVHIPDFSKKFIVVTDASDVAMGAVLMQDIDGHKRVIEYASKMFNKAQRNYSTIEKEANAIVFALKKWQVYLEGKPFSIQSDHRPLTWLLSKKDCVGKLARWALLLQEFDIEEIRHIKGNENVVADALSRIEINLLEHEQNTEGLPQDNTIVINGKKYLIENNKKRLIITDNEDKKFIVKMVHDEFGHFGLFKCSEIIRSRFYWKNWKVDLKNYLKKCEKCQTKGDDNESKEPLVLRNVHLLKPWQKVSIDICGPLTLSSKNKRYLLLGQDLFTKYVIGKSVREIKASEICKWLKEVAKVHGFPQEILVDQGSQFNSQEFKKFCQENNLKIHFISAYHHQSNGQIERFNRTIEKMIRTSISDQKKWCTVVDKMLRAYNVTPHCSTKISPWEALYGTQPKTQLDEKWPTLLGDRSLEIIKQEVGENLKKSQEIAKKYYDRTIKPSICKVGSIVWWHCPEQGLEKSKKLNIKWQGPFRVIEIDYPVAVLEDLNGKIKKIHLNHIKICNDEERSLGLFRFRGRPNLRRGGVEGES